MTVENARSPLVLKAIKLLEQLLADGGPLPSKIIREHAAQARIPEPALRVAKGHLGVVAEPQFGIGSTGRRVYAGWTWRLPPPELPPPPAPKPAPTPAPLPPITDLPPEARAECVRINGRWTHPLGDDEYRRLAAGGKPLPKPSREPWLRSRR